MSAFEVIVAINLVLLWVGILMMAKGCKTMLEVIDILGDTIKLLQMRLDNHIEKGE